MNFFDGIRRQLRSVIQWENPSDETLFERWTDNGDEIKNASKLIIGPGQGCIFMYKGKVEAVLTEEGILDLKTDNIPFWTTVSRFMQFFESEHKVGIFFFRRAKVLNQKWGTTSIIKYQDPVYKFPVGLKVYGNYSFRITDPKGFFVNVIAGATRYSSSNFRDIMVDRIVQPLSDFLAEAKYTYTEIDSNREEISAGIQVKLNNDFEKLGFILTDFRIEGTNFDEETQKRINRIADISAEALAAEAAGVNFANLQQLEAMREAARNEGGSAGAGVGIGAGIGLGQMMSAQMATPPQQQSQATSNTNDPLEKLKKLKAMREADLITEEEYTAKKKEILDTL